ncbi:hypothetical protein RA8CHR_00734 [Variovorax sp. RA8]|nr:hypothetical protein RA8CHR_00734 [Variovorax sp. RA8]
MAGPGGCQSVQLGCAEVACGDGETSFGSGSLAAGSAARSNDSERIDASLVPGISWLVLTVSRMARAGDERYQTLPSAVAPASELMTSQKAARSHVQPRLGVPPHPAGGAVGSSAGVAP